MVTGDRQVEKTRGHHRTATRRCIVSGEVLARDDMVRFALDPDQVVVPDIGAVLPGRGLWLTARRDIVSTACGKNLFARAARSNARAPQDLADQVEALLAHHCLQYLGLARRAGQVVAGFEVVRQWVRRGKAALLVVAEDAAQGGRQKLQGLAPQLLVVDLFDRFELGRALGRDGVVVNAALAPGRLADSFRRDAARLAGFRRPATGGADGA